MNVRRVFRDGYTVFMRTVRLFHWRPSEAESLIGALREAAYEVIYRAGTQAPSVREIKDADTFAIVTDLSRLPSHGRNVGAWLRGSKSTRNIPLIFVDGHGPRKSLTARTLQFVTIFYLECPASWPESSL